MVSIVAPIFRPHWGSTDNIVARSWPVSGWGQFTQSQLAQQYGLPDERSRPGDVIPLPIVTSLSPTGHGSGRLPRNSDDRGGVVVAGVWETQHAAAGRAWLDPQALHLSYEVDRLEDAPHTPAASGGNDLGLLGPPKQGV